MSPETALPLQPPSAYEANRDIVFMTLPLLALSTYFYGARPAVLCLTAAFTAMLCDHLVAWLRHRPCDKTENSSIPSALVLVLLLPATVHYYVVVVSVAVAILLGKHAFGGYGHYPFNPAAFGYAVAAVSWPGEVFLYPVPFTTMSVLDTGSATVMESVSHTLRAGGVPNVDTFDLILGNYAGPIGATSVLILVACAMYLWMRRDITLGIPFGFLLSCALVADPIVLKRYERPQRERVRTALRKGIITSLGYILMLLLISGLREFLGAGALMGTQVMKNALFPMAQLPSGGFILLALVMCVWRAAAASVKQQMSLGAEHL